MELKDMFAAVRNDWIEFATIRPPGSNFSILERRVIVIGPPELVNLSRTGDLFVVDELVKFLKQPDKAWAAEVLLAAMTRKEEKIVDSFAAAPNDWLDSVGKTASDRWAAWLRKARERLVWDPENKVFVERE